MVTTTTRTTRTTSTTSLTETQTAAVRGAEGSLGFDVVVAAVNGGPGVGTVQINAQVGGATKRLCTVTLTGSGVAHCALTASQLKAGTYTVGAFLKGSSSLEWSQSATSTLTVT